MQKHVSSFKKNAGKKKYTRRAILEFAVFAALLSLDLIVKHFTALNVANNESVTLINGIIALTFTKNTGAAFSILSDSFYFLLIVRLILSVTMLCLLFVYHKKLTALLRIGMCLIVAGAVGNLYDQIRFGYVRDMFEFLFIKFAVFNIADTCIVLGVIFLSLGALTNKGSLSDKKEKTNVE